LPGNQINDLFRISRASIKLEQLLERAPTPGELAEVLELPEGKIADTLSKGLATVSVDAASNYDYEHSLLDILADKQAVCPEGGLMRDSLITDLMRVMGRLPEKQQTILKYAYGFDNYPVLTNDDIAYRIGLTTERVRQLRIKAITALRQFCVTNRMTDYF
jgi:RNA polymerase primary sigma factor